VIEPEIDPEDALKIAQKHPKVRELAKGRSRAVLVRPKPAHRGEPDDKSQVVVGLYDYDENRSVIALLDAKTKKVTAVEVAPASFQLSEEERKEAEALAADDPRVKKFLGKRKMNPLTRLYFPPGTDREPRPHRFAIVFLRPTPTRRQYAVVDLSERRIADVLTHRDLTGR